MSEPPTIKQILHTADGITDKPMETKNERTFTQAEMDAAVELALSNAVEICEAKAVYANRSRHGKDDFTKGLLSELENILRDTGKNIKALITHPVALEAYAAERERKVREARLDTIQHFLDKKRELYEIGSRESEAIQFVANILLAGPQPGAANPVKEN